MPALVKISIEDIVKAHHPGDEKWPGLIIDVPEDQIVTDLALATEQCKKLEPLNVRIAIDNFGRAYSSMAKVEELPFEELKLDRAFVADCGTDKVNAPLCKTVIDLAHNFGRSVVAVGIEKAADALALVSSDPEEENLVRCDQQRGRIKHCLIPRLLRPAERGERQQSGREPRI